MTETRKTDLMVRGAGLVLAAIGGLFLKVGLFDVLRDAETDARTVSTSLMALLLASAAIVLGLLVLVLGTSGRGQSGPIGRRVRGSDGKPSRVLGVVVVIAIFAPGIALYVWLQLRLRELGFH